MTTILRHNHRIVTVVLIFICILSANAQSSSQRYNETLRITEYYNATGIMTGFSRYNKAYHTIDFYSMEGIKLRSEPAKVDSTYIASQKKAYPKTQLTKQELDAVQEWRYQKIEGQRLICEETPDLERIGLYNLKGKLVAIKQYNRLNENWMINFLSTEEEEGRK